MTIDDTSTPWLSIIGIGEDGLSSLSPVARTLIETAELIIGGKRHLRFVDSLASETRVWPSPLQDIIPELKAMRGRPVVALASGDPFHFGVGTTLLRHFSHSDMQSIPQPSSFSLVANKLGWALQDAVTLGLNSRKIETLRPHLRPNTKIIALSRDGSTPRTVAKLLVDHKCEDSRLVILTAVGGDRETIWQGTAVEAQKKNFDDLNIMAIDVVCQENAHIIPLTSGLPDDWFFNDGQLTKREIRTVTLSNLAPRPGEHLWDLGCGCGSVAIEWMLLHPKCTASGIDNNETRLALAAKNAQNLGVPGLRLHSGNSEIEIVDLPTPNAVFIGGGCTAALIEKCWAVLNQDGRMVVNAVTLETQNLLQQQQSKKGGALLRINVERADAIGRKMAWRPALPIMQWTGVKT